MTNNSIIAIVPFLILSGASASVSSNMLNNAKRLRGSLMSNGASGVARRGLLESHSISFISSDHKQILGLCEGDCDSDEDCGPGLTCFQRDGLQEVPGCSGSTTDFSGYDFCYSHVSTYGPLEFKGENPSLALGPCQGDCDSDADCADGLVCYQRRSSFAGGLIPGCSIETHEFDGENFCYDPSQGVDSSTPTAPVAPPPVASPVAAPTPVPIAPTKAPVPSPTLAPVAPTQAPVAPTLSPVAPTQAPVAPTLPPFSGPNFVLDLTLDYWPGETRWEVVDKCNGDEIVFHGGPYTATHRNAIISETASIGVSRYEFRIYDSYGDGMSVRTGDPGGFVVKFYGTEVGSGSGNFGSQKTLFFGNNSC